MGGGSVKIISETKNNQKTQGENPMSKKEKLTTSQVDGVQYKRAKMW